VFALGGGELVEDPHVRPIALRRIEERAQEAPVGLGSGHLDRVIHVHATWTFVFIGSVKIGRSRSMYVFWWAGSPRMSLMKAFTSPEVP